MSEARRKARGLKLAHAVMTVARRSGGLPAEVAGLMALGNKAEMRALWMALEDKGLVSADQRENYLDRGMDAVCAEVDAEATRVIEAG